MLVDLTPRDAQHETQVVNALRHEHLPSHVSDFNERRWANRFTSGVSSEKVVHTPNASSQTLRLCRLDQKGESALKRKGDRC
jgi:hypothetical protein